MLQYNNQIYCLDDLSSGQNENINLLKKNKNFTFIHHDICENFHSLIKFDFILNFACPASPIHYQEEPIKTINTNFVGTLKMLDLAKKNDSLILQASTSEVN